jgi:two-component sensor histidine kinase
MKLSFFSIRTNLIFLVILALVPITILSFLNAQSALRYTKSVLANRLVTSAWATAGQERRPFIDAERKLMEAAIDPAILSGGSGCRSRLARLVPGKHAILNLARSDAEGNVLCSIRPITENVNFSGQAWWKNGIAAPGYTVSMPTYGPITKKDVFVGMLPIRQPGKATDGAITASIDIAWFRKSLQKNKLSPDAVIAISDYRGEVLIKSSNSPLPVFSELNTGGQTGNLKSADGVKWIYATAPLYEEQLFIIYAEPQNILLRNAIWQSRISIALPLLALLLTMIALWFGTRYLITKWLSLLQKTTNKFARGEYDDRGDIFTSAPYEIRILANDMLQMAHTITERNHNLETLVKEQKTLTMEVHHRVKNNLQIVTSLLSLQAFRIVDPAARMALDQTRNRMGALALIHRLLYEQSDTQNVQRVKMSRLVSELCSQIRMTYRDKQNVAFTCEAGDFELPIDNAVPLALFAVEAITNSYRHAFPDNRIGNMKLKFAVSNTEASIVVEDDGVGIAEQLEISAMGTELMQAFASQLNGKVTVGSASPNGTKVSLHFPVQPE